MSGIMDPNLFHAAQLDAAPYLIFQKILGHREQPIIHAEVIQALHVILNILCQKWRDTDDAVALRRLGRCNDVAPL